MRVELFDMSVQWSGGLDFNFQWELRRAIAAVFQTVFAVFFWVDAREDVALGAGLDGEGEQGAQHFVFDFDNRV